MSSGHRYRWMIVGLVLIALVTVAGITTFRYVGTEPAGATVRNRGTPAPVTEHDRRILAASMNRFTGDVFFLRTEAGSNFYRVPKTDGSDCFATSAIDSPVLLGALLCSPDFPQHRPVLDFSVVGADRPETRLRLISMKGVAADEVSEIRLVSRTSETLATVPVAGNVFAVRQLPTTGNVEAIVAVDENGTILSRSELSGR